MTVGDFHFWFAEMIKLPDVIRISHIFPDRADIFIGSSVSPLEG